MLASTKADLEPNRPFRSTKSATRFPQTWPRNGQNKPRQQFAYPDLLRRAKPPPAPAPEDQLTLSQLMTGKGQKARRNSCARSSLSQEKLPSGPVGRPKWP